MAVLALPNNDCDGRIWFEQQAVDQVWADVMLNEID